ncbi:MAG: tryptophan-rich sensory protein [Sandaracinus sp.]|nr:tryptophan-rich sensory protein [Sandaracinus sp.]MCB9631822.1 tryptophan-rich sensory protein [Sandaracinus sp.]MCB9637185.1 tryptophan-rich sensory protein [Sandaracinus sp.]
MRRRRPSGTRRHLKHVALAAAAVVATAVLGTLVTAPAIAEGWYASLALPTWTPPRSVFGPAWTALYAMQIAAVALVIRREGDPVRPAALLFFGLQLTLNAAWSVLFFGLRSPIAGLVDISLLFVMLAATTYLFFLMRPLAGALMVPNLMWVAFAASLNLAIVVG